VVPCDHLECHLADPPRLVTEGHPDLRDGLVAHAQSSPRAPQTRNQQRSLRSGSRNRGAVGPASAATASASATPPRRRSRQSATTAARPRRAHSASTLTRGVTPQDPSGMAVILANVSGWGWSRATVPNRRSRPRECLRGPGRSCRPRERSPGTSPCSTPRKANESGTFVRPLAGSVVRVPGVAEAHDAHFVAQVAAEPAWQVRETR